MGFVERRTTVLKKSYQCKSLNFLGTDLCVFINDFNRKSMNIQKMLVTQGWEASSVQTRIRISDKILVTLRMDTGETRLELMLPNAWLEMD